MVVAGWNAILVEGRLIVGREVRQGRPPTAGYRTGPSMPLWFNLEECIRELPISVLSAHPGNSSYHNYLADLSTPADAKSLLGLGLNYCISSQKNQTTSTFNRVQQDVRRKCIFPKLHLEMTTITVKASASSPTTSSKKLQARLNLLSTNSDELSSPNEPRNIDVSFFSFLSKE